MTIKNLNQAEALEAVAAAAENVETLREYAKEVDVTFSGNTGAAKLAEKLVAHITDNYPKGPDLQGLLNDGDDEEIQVAKVVKKPAGPSIEDLLAMKASEVENVNLRRQVVRAQALRLIRVQIVNLNPGDSELHGAIVSLTNKYTGRVSKFIPYDPEVSKNGYHVPKMLVDHLKSKKFVLRRKIKSGDSGIPRYTTSYVNKFQITELPPLTEKELAELSARQKASASIEAGG